MASYKSTPLFIGFRLRGRRAGLLLLLAFVSCATLGLVSPDASAAPTKAPRKPNFIFIFTDDQRWDALGVVQREQGKDARFPWLRTPQLDRLAADGIRFRNAFVVSSLCSPSRAGYLTGRYNHFNGVANNRTSFPEDSVTHATLLRDAGYETGYCGKWHMGEAQGIPPEHFDFTAGYIGQGIYEDCFFWVNGKPTATNGWVDKVTTDYALQFIERNAKKPFSLIVGFKSPHTPCDPPEKYKDQYAGEKYYPPVNENATPLYPIEGTDAEAITKDYNTRPRFLDHFRTLSGVDDNVGRLLDALDELGLAEDTVVIFSSDQGYFVGEHGLRDKRSAYEECIRVPLLVRYPRMTRAGTVNDAMTLNIDLAPTLLDLAGARIPKEMQGRSWRPLLQGQTDDWRNSFLYEYFFECDHPATPTTVAVRTADAKIIQYPHHPQWIELYDLSRDPYEMTNLADDPKAKDLLTRMQAEYQRQYAAVQYTIPPYADRLDQEPPSNTRTGRERAKARADAMEAFRERYGYHLVPKEPITLQPQADLMVPGKKRTPGSRRK